MEFRVLGSVEVRDGDRRLEVGGPKPRAVLAVLLAHANREVRPEQLIEAVWPGGPPRTAVSILHTLIYRLRKRLAEQLHSSNVELLRGPVGYALRLAPDQLDATRFERLIGEGREALEAGDHEHTVARLRAGLRLWRAEAFADVEVDAVRERAKALSELRLVAVEWCLTADLALGRAAEVVVELESLIAENPYRERFWALLMTALCRCGRRADALAAYQRLYKLLDDDLGVQPSQPLRELQQRILAGDPALDVVVERPASSAKTEPVVPRQLPFAVDYFAGRKEQLDQLDALLPATAAVVAVIAGPAGVGKTTLANHWAHRVADRFPDGQLYINLQGFDPSGRPVRTSDALRGFLEALDVAPDRIPSELEAAAALYRSRLAGKRTLVVLDNAVDEEQVRPLLPASPGSLVLVTSRNQLTGLITAEAARPIQLDNLAGSESHDLLAHRIGPARLAGEPQAADSIIARCDGLPLALAIVAARAETHPSFPLRALADELEASKLSLDAFAGLDLTTDLRTVLSWSYRQLDDAGQRLFRLLALHPGPDLTAPAAASLAAQPASAIREELAELCRVNLLTEHLPGRFAFHDLLRAYATELVHATDSQPDRHAAERRCLEHYVGSAFTAALLITPSRFPIELSPPADGVEPEPLGDDGKAMSWFSAERVVLLSLLRRFTDARLDVQLWQLVWTLDDFLRIQGDWRSREFAQNLALDLTTRLGDNEAEARIRRLAGSHCIERGRTDEATVHLRRALRLDIENGDQRGEAGSNYFLAYTLYRRGEYLDSLDHALQARSLYQSLGNGPGEARSLDGAASCCVKLGRLEEARRYAEDALALLEKTGDNSGIAPAWRTLGYVHLGLGNQAEAIKAYHQALDKFRGFGDKYGEADALDQLGDAHHAAGDLPAAINYWRQALVILEAVDHLDAEQVRAKLAAAT